jgi:hypothetical protein
MRHVHQGIEENGDDKGSIDDVDDHNDRKLDNTHCWDGGKFVKDPLRH